jgi:hypothetical protein
MAKVTKADLNVEIINLSTDKEILEGRLSEANEIIDKLSNYKNLYHASLLTIHALIENGEVDEPGV